MTQQSYAEIWADGLWNNNVVLGQMLALCPLMAVTTTASNGLGMGIATLAVMLVSNMLVSMIRGIITPQVRIPVFILLIAAMVTLVDMFLNAWMHELYQVLGLFIPLIVTNCAILGRVESFASKNNVGPSMIDGLAMGVGFTWVLVLLGGMRELLGSGTLFADASLLLGNSFAFIEMTIFPDYGGTLLLILPPGGFICLGLILAGKRVTDRKLEARRNAMQGRLQEESV
ncbi:electron transport complex subunit E [Amphritea pacifica]|uniref:Ion-translocating oxidoreductase complex subunit E n=1 Tax=Amphritea pacifica TaxID=2811233 RepID=A0ABS2WDD4_9GAMM|nr:electron transport complex subunit E [Amphritea pacifica]MBN0989716.1 electron transport complex subunit E [Amphritea pacifica]MBN1007385.1 electron transport complex subunit E [Amphritea pacifica]